MWPTCLIRKKQPSSSKRLLLPRQPRQQLEVRRCLRRYKQHRRGPDERRPVRNTMKDQITIEGHDGAFAAYIARPKTVSAPAVIVLQELFGVNADIRKHCDELAEQ